MSAEGTRFAVTGHRALAEPRRVREEADLVIRSLPRPLVCVSALAQGADQIVAAVALAQGAELEVVLPADDYETTLGENVEEFRRLRSAAVGVTRLPHPCAQADAYVDAGDRMLDDADLLIAVWDGGPSRGHGGTADVVRMARDRGIPVTLIAGRRAGS